MMELRTPSGGFMSSGLSRDLGLEGLRAYLEAKMVAVPRGYFPRVEY